MAADITITSGTTVTTQQTLTDPGDTGTVESGGTVDTTNADGFHLSNTNQRLDNNGTITTTGNTDDAIFADSANATIVNNGAVNASGPDVFGINTIGNNATITNNGTVTTTGSNGRAISSIGTNGSIVNNGTITTTGDGAFGIDPDGEGISVTNNGTVTTSGVGANGIDADADNVSITNTGTITVTGSGSDGIDSDNAGAILLNSGTITASGSQGNGMDMGGNNSRMTNTGTVNVSGNDSNGLESTSDGGTVINSGTVRNTGTRSGAKADEGHGISVDAANATVTNSGKVSSSNGSSIYMEGANGTLNLEQGTILQGLITHATPGSATFNYAVGRSAILTFNALPNTINTSGLPSWTSGTTLTVVDPSDFRLSSLNTVLTSLTGETASAIEARIDQGRFEPQAFVATHGAARSNESTANPWSYWAGSFGGVLDRSGTDGFDRTFGGLVGGADRSVAAGTTVGALSGFSLGNTESDDGIHEADTYSVFGGAYAAQTWQDLFADVAFTLGYLRSDDDITVLNNSVTGGLQDLSLGYDYFYISPSVRVGTSVPYWDGIISPSLRLRYAGLWQGGSSEQSTLRFKTNNRSLHVLEVRSQAAYDFAPYSTDTGHLDISFKGGVDTAVTLSDSADASVNGAAISLSLDDDVVVRGFGGVQATWETMSGLEWSAGLEGGYDSAKTVSATARLRLRALF